MPDLPDLAGPLLAALPVLIALLAGAGWVVSRVALPRSRARPPAAPPPVLERVQEAHAEEVLHANRRLEEIDQKAQRIAQLPADARAAEVSNLLIGGRKR